MNPFLDVTHSARGFFWKSRSDEAAEFEARAIAQQNDVPEIVARLLAARGATTQNAATFLSPTLRELMPDPHELKDMDKGADRLARAIQAHEKIAVLGDYDVDGGTSSALLRLFLKAHGLDCRLYIPDRMKEGYGPNLQAITTLAHEGASLILTVDCGITSFEALQKGRELGTDIVVVDHHQAEQELPDVLAVINPNRLDDLSGQGHLCAAGVVFLTLVATLRLLRESGWYQKTGLKMPDLRQWLDLVALATICDVVPLTGLNRAYVQQGLVVMKARQNVGLRALADVAGLDSAPTSYHLGFILGPRINAGGRIGRSSLGAELLSEADPQRALKLAQELEAFNAERKAMQEEMIEEAIAWCEQLLEKVPNLPILIVDSPKWHKGIVGLVSSRLTERFRLPSLVICWTGENDEGTGSARSINGVDLGEAVRMAMKTGLLVKGGGHAMAAGLTVKQANMQALKDFLIERLYASVKGLKQAAPELEIDGALTARAANLDFITLVEKAGPYGPANPQPRFVFPGHTCTQVRVVGTHHVRCTLVASDGARLGGIAFRAADTPVGEMLLRSEGKPLHVAGQVKRDHWGGREKVDLIIEDVAEPR